MVFFHSRDENIFSDSPRYFAAPQTGTQFIISEVNFLITNDKKQLKSKL